MHTIRNPNFTTRVGTFKGLSFWLLTGIREGGRKWGRPYILGQIGPSGSTRSIGIDWTLPIIIPKWRERLDWLRWAVDPRPVYYVVDSTDCDHARSTSARRASCGHQYRKARERTYDDAEGITHIWRVSKAEYQRFEPEHRDLALEAFEDGHPHLIRR